MDAVLIAEEDDVIRGLIRAIVENAGYGAAEVTSGDQAFRMAQRFAYSAIVLDCLGRSGQGLETLKRLRCDTQTCDVPVIALCGLGQYAADLGLWAKAVVVKPFRPAQLLMKLQTVIRASAASTAYSAVPSTAASLSRVG